MLIPCLTSSIPYELFGRRYAGIRIQRSGQRLQSFLRLRQGPIICSSTHFHVIFYQGVLVTRGEMTEVKHCDGSTDLVNDVSPLVSYFCPAVSAYNCLSTLM